MDNDEEINVYVEGVIHVFPKSDTKLVELFSDRTARVIVNYALKTYEGFVSPKTARKLDGYAAQERSVRLLADAVAEQEVENDFKQVIDYREKLMNFKSMSKPQQTPK